MISISMIWRNGLHLTSDGTKWLANNFPKYLKCFLENIDFTVNSRKLMDWQTNKAKLSDINGGIKEVIQDSSESSIRSDSVSKSKTKRTQNVNKNIIGNLNINSFFSKCDDLEVLMTGMFYILISETISSLTVSDEWVFHTI